MIVQVRHFAGAWYTVHYAKHWWLPMRTIEERRDLGIDALTAAWTAPKLFEFEEARRFAQELKNAGPASATERERRLHREIDNFETLRRGNLKANRAREFRL